MKSHQQVVTQIGSVLPNVVLASPEPAEQSPAINANEPLLSIVTPTYNSMRYFEETADSVRRLDIPFEWIIVDDCSTDGTLEYLDCIARSDGRVVLLLNERRSGKPRVNYSRGLDAARGRYVLFLDHDDTIDPGAVEHGIDRLLDTAGANVLFMKVAYIDGASRAYKIKTIPGATYNGSIRGTRLFWTVMLCPTYPLKQGAVIVKKDLFEKVGHVFDIELVLAVCPHTDFLLLDEVGLNYRNVRSSLSSGVAIRLKDREGFWLRLVDTYFPSDRRWLKGFFKAYKWLLGWTKIAYSCVSARRI